MEENEKHRGRRHKTGGDKECGEKKKKSPPPPIFPRNSIVPPINNGEEKLISCVEC